MATITHTPVPVGRCAVSSSEARLADMATQTHMAGSPVFGKVSFAIRAPHVTRQRKACRPVVTAKATKTETGEKALTGVVYEPFVEVQNQALQIPNSPKESLARQRFDSASESAINDQINVEYNASYIYHALWSYFDRDNVALPGLAKYFKDSSAEERGHAEAFMEYQNKRGGRVKLQSIVLPPMEFGNEEKGDALYAMELVLSIEKLTTEKLHAVYKIAEENNDSQLTNFLDEYLAEQVEEIKEVSSYVAQLRRIGNDGHGVYYWDSLLK